MPFGRLGLWLIAFLVLLLSTDLAALWSKASLEPLLTTIVWEGEPGPAFPVAAVALMMLCIIGLLVCGLQFLRSLRRDL